MRTRVLLALSLFLAAPLAAQEKADPPKADDPVGAQLLKDKEAYAAALDKAREDLLKGFDKVYESVKASKSMKIEAQLALLEKIEAEKKAFEDAGTFPSLPAMKVALSEYRTAQKKAEAACKVAFDKAAKAYRDKGELKAAGDTLEEMKEFLSKTPTAGGGGAAVLVLSAHSGKVFGLKNGMTDEGTLVLASDYVKGQPTQQWRTVPAGDGWLYVQNVKSGTVLTVNGKGNGAEAHVAKKKEGGDGQLWKIVPVENQKDTIKLMSKGSTKVLGIDGRSKNAGARIILWDDNGGTSEWFGIVPAK